MELIKVQTKLAEENLANALWKECDDLNERPLKLKERPGTERMLCNLARRVRAMEEKLGIAKGDSVVIKHL